jgi:hypothetical protein
LSAGIVQKVLQQTLRVRRSQTVGSAFIIGPGRAKLAEQRRLVDLKRHSLSKSVLDKLIGVARVLQQFERHDDDVPEGR